MAKIPNSPNTKEEQALLLISRKMGRENDSKWSHCKIKKKKKKKKQ
jgi:hypothetical protein